MSLLCVFLFLVLAGRTAISYADVYTYHFYSITNNNPVNAAVGEAQLSVDVSSVAERTDQVMFKFYNNGSAASSITDIYFDDGTLLGIANILMQVGVLFSEGAIPRDLPGGDDIDPDFNVTQGFLADSDSPVQPNGVNPGESVGILFNLIPGNNLDFDDVIAALFKAGDPGGLRIGIKVQGFADPEGGSESFINNNVPVPVPAAAILGMLGLTVAGLKLREYA